LQYLTEIAVYLGNGTMVIMDHW